jgi:hypothetical protein
MLFLPFVSPWIIIFLAPYPYNLYDLAIIDKHERLENTEAPRIVLAGGSNLAFGIDSALIQNALDIPVINAGVHAGFGLGRILDDIAPFLKLGDILIIVSEYGYFVSESSRNGNEAAYYLIFGTRQYRLLANPPLYGFPAGMLSHVKNKASAWYSLTRPPNPLAYTRDGFNEYGDYIKHLNMEDRHFESATSSMVLQTQYLARFFRLVEMFAERGIRVLISYPSFEELSFAASEAFIRELDAKFRAYKSLTVISSPEDYAFPRDCFYDTFHHLNAKGRELRTARLIRDLERYF